MKIRGWIEQEIEDLKAKGATDADLREDAFASLLAERVAAKYWDEVYADKEFLKAIFDDTILRGSPEQLRQLAVRLRASGEADAAYELEELADQRERGIET